MKDVENYVMRNVVNAYQNIEGKMVDVLECGHEVILKEDEIASNRRRCRECKENKEIQRKEEIERVLRPLSLEMAKEVIQRAGAAASEEEGQQVVIDLLDGVIKER